MKSATLLLGHYYGMDDDAYEHAITNECLIKSGHLSEEDAIYESQMTYDPFNIHMGQLTVYRCVVGVLIFGSLTI